MWLGISFVVVSLLTSGVSSAAPVYPRLTTATSIVAAVGDSITAGSGVTDPARAWPQVLDDRLFGPDRAHVFTVGHPGQCLVFVGCGYPTRLVDSWVPEVLNHVPAPTTIVLEIGINDLSHASTADMESAYLSLVGQANARGIRVIVGTITPRDADIWWTSYWTWGPQMDDVNTWIRGTFGTNVADFNLELKNPNDWGARKGTMSPDGLHPDNEGAEDMGYRVPLSQVG